MPKMCIFEKNL